VLIVPGVLLATDYAKSESVTGGGPLGDLIQWADLIAGLYMLGHNVTIMKDIYQVSRGLRYSRFMWSPKEGCKMKDFDIIYADIIAMKTFPTDVLDVYSCKFRVLDAYGTQVMYNDPVYSLEHNFQSNYGHLGLNLQQFYTFYPHTQDNTFLGFAVELPKSESKMVEKKERIGLLYGKDPNYFKKHKLYIHQLMDWMEVHVTVGNITTLPAGIINHGILSSEDYRKLLGRVQFFIGMGLPLESTGVIEAIAHGCIFLNPKFKGSQQDILQKLGKPTLRKLTSQVPYMERFMGSPHVYTLDIEDTQLVADTLKTAMDTFTNRFVPFEFTVEGFLERLNAFVDRQHFCEKEDDATSQKREKHGRHNILRTWIRLSAMKVLLGTKNNSCSDTCYANGLMCEPSFFHQFNKGGVFERQNIDCREHEKEADIYFPAVNKEDSVCTLQKHSSLYSCAGAHPSWQRLCACRDYVKHQVALCTRCG
ncbi:Alpha-1,6-mannosylglycoprotein 6-beta-N-acetylglucosaminyltransferase A, partial [Lamellibrachia satsuma]